MKKRVKIILSATMLTVVILLGTKNYAQKRVSYTNGFGITVSCEVTAGDCLWDGHNYSNPRYEF